MGIIRQIIESYKLAFLFIGLAMPLVLVPTIAEGVQHIVEYNLGMFALKEGDVFSDKKQAIRFFFGAIKVVAIMYIWLILPRFFLSDGNKKKATSFSRESVGLLVKGVIVTVVMIVWIFLIGPKVLSALIPSFSQMQIILLSLSSPILIGLLVMKPINNWFAGIWGLPMPTEAQHKGMNKAIYGPGVIVQFAAILPAMILHYWLGLQAMGQAGFILAAILLLDSVVVGILACLIASCTYVLVRDVLQNH